ncbi:hypothetical protein EBL_c25940 [Shimwellia blattae DSM 4481 = NBRC 105725]|uniref:Uncharacterized protein n=1 Tax=Shimwellia blattae (strain ATCC 29907 / DSM 4481 / JCM 1650 / NBRC 105725 / CDC 9005-74) TaxID=630626 RepID=I2BAX6_SHIBC|nr:hypothetical protein EBL_c25940 [Shimwellia blattae DSM 4481 = NBRC 105725]
MMHLRSAISHPTLIFCINHITKTLTRDCFTRGPQGKKNNWLHPFPGAPKQSTKMVHFATIASIFMQCYKNSSLLNQHVEKMA